MLVLSTDDEGLIGSAMPTALQRGRVRMLIVDQDGTPRDRRHLVSWLDRRIRGGLDPVYSEINHRATIGVVVPAGT